MKKLLYRTVSAKTFVFLFFALIAVCALVFGGGAFAQKTSAEAQKRDPPVIVIDAGHGGEDGGASSSSGIIEKDINLSISMKVKSLLDTIGFKTVSVRSDDRLIYDSSCKTMREKKVCDIHKRLDIMNSYPGCIFLSIHQNHFSQSKYTGAQVFYSKNTPESALLAECIQNSFAQNLQKENTRKIKPSGTEIYLLYHAKETAVMVECGFLSNGGEAELLNDNDYQTKTALTIVSGLMQYLSNSRAGV